MVSATEEVPEELAQQGMVDLGQLAIQLEVPLGHIGRVVGAVDQHVVPRLVAGWLRLVVLISGLIRLTVRVDRHDHSPIIVAFVMHQLPGLESGGRVFHGGPLAAPVRLNLAARAADWSAGSSRPSRSCRR